MKAMILAAGLGTRLKPLTDTMPKALVKVDGVPMLERILKSLKRQGFSRITVNVHHFPEQIEAFLNSKDFGVNISISDESDELLDTGGGIVKAHELLFTDDAPVLIHNVDILSNADLVSLMKYHMESGNDATLLVSPRESSRKLIFNTNNMEMVGWHDLTSDNFRPAEISLEEGMVELAFSGIYVIGKEFVEDMREKMGVKKYSIMEYLLSEKRKLKVGGLLQTDLKLIDIGKPATLSRAPEILNEIEEN